jgi:hypothetical protein
MCKLKELFKTNLAFKWFLLTLLNSVLGIFLGLTLAFERGFDFILGIAFGLFLWWAVFLLVDWFLLKKAYKLQSKILKQAVFARAALQAVPYIDILFAAGVVMPWMRSVGFNQYLDLSADMTIWDAITVNDFALAFVATALMGLFFAVLVAVFFLLGTFVYKYGIDKKMKIWLQKKGLKKRTLLKWLLLVFINTLAGWFWGLQFDLSFLWVLGIVFGILTWWIFYIAVDFKLLKHKRYFESKMLSTTALIRAFLQSIYAIDVLIGIYVVGFTEEVLLISADTGPSFLASYVITVLMGLAYSVIIGVFFWIGYALVKLYNWRKSRKNIAESSK